LPDGLPLLLLLLLLQQLLSIATAHVDQQGAVGVRFV
jgi:hypothetical protein